MDQEWFPENSVQLAASVNPRKSYLSFSTTKVV
jgi:hypothetical protein